MRQSVATGIKALASGRKDIYKVDPTLLTVEDGFNARVDYSGEEELREFIRQNGVPGVYKIYEKNGKYCIKDGHRRQRAVLSLINEGTEIKSVDCILEKETEQERVFGLLSTNEGKPFSALEKGIIYHRLLKFGWTQMEIAAKTGKSQSHISNCILLARAPKKVQQLMIDNVVPDTTVLTALSAMKDIPDASDDKLIEIITDAAKEAEAVGEGSRGTSKRIRERVGRPSSASRIKELGEFIEENQIVMKDNKQYTTIQAVYDFIKGQMDIEELMKRIS